jgi:DNA repair exonuclease SbcCD ATPase subunit
MGNGGRMARRRLSDLLREEANKPSEDTPAATEVEPSTDELDAEALDAGEETIASDSAPTKATTTAKGRATKRTEAKEPEAAPEPKQDDTLLQKITDLTTALEAQKETIEQLQTDLKQTRKDARQLTDANAKLVEELKTIEQLQTDLEQTRKDARQLTDANAKLAQELKTLQAKKTAVDNSALPVPVKLAPQELKLAPAPVEASAPVETSAPVEASAHPLNSFNRDVGWFD